MTTASPSHAGSRKSLIVLGRILSALSVVGLVMSASMKLAHAPKLVEQFTTRSGFQESVLTPLAIVEITCALIYAMPRTSVLGAVLLTGYLGGAIATHVRVGEGFGLALSIASFVWGGIFLREERLRALLPLRTGE